MRFLLLLPLVCSGCWLWRYSGPSDTDPEEVLSQSCGGPQLELGTTVVREAFGGSDLGSLVAVGTECGDLDLELPYKWQVPVEGTYEIRVESTVPVVLGFGREYRSACLNFDACEVAERDLGRFGLVPSEPSSENGGAGGVLEIPDIENVFVATLRTDELRESPGHDYYIAVGRARPADPDETAPYVLTITQRD